MNTGNGSPRRGEVSLRIGSESKGRSELVRTIGDISRYERSEEENDEVNQTTAGISKEENWLLG